MRVATIGTPCAALSSSLMRVPPPCPDRHDGERRAPVEPPRILERAGERDAGLAGKLRDLARRAIAGDDEARGKWQRPAGASAKFASRTTSPRRCSADSPYCRRTGSRAGHLAFGAERIPAGLEGATLGMTAMAVSAGAVLEQTRLAGRGRKQEIETRQIVMPERLECISLRLGPRRAPRAAPFPVQQRKAAIGADVVLVAIEDETGGPPPACIHAAARLAR